MIIEGEHVHDDDMTHDEDVSAEIAPGMSADQVRKAFSDMGLDPDKVDFSHILTPRPKLSLRRKITLKVYAWLSRHIMCRLGRHTIMHFLDGNADGGQRMGRVCILCGYEETVTDPDKM